MQTQTKTQNVPWTILRLLEWTTVYFKKYDVESPRAAAEILLAQSLDLRRIDLYLRYDQPVMADELTRFKAAIKRRANREPVAYIVGAKEFWSMELVVTPDVLIPRPETECLVEAALSHLRAIKEQTNVSGRQAILELGTGSGAIILALAKERPGHFFAAGDISPAAIKVARENSKRHDLDAFVHFFCADWLTPLKTGGLAFDLIVSNPPYIRGGDIGELEPEIHLYEPKMALDGGPDGLNDLRRIINTAPGCLKADGRLMLEIGYDQKKELKEIVERQGGYKKVDFIRDYSGHDRVAVITAAS